MVMVLLGTGLGVAGFMFLGGSHKPTPKPTPSQKTTGSAPVTEPTTIPPSLMNAARPTRVTATDDGQVVILHWHLSPTGQKYQIIINVQPNHPAYIPVGIGKNTFAVGGLSTSLGYCFQVGALLANGNPAPVSWSHPACIRGAVPRT
jgi:hypothetical protein